MDSRLDFLIIGTQKSATSWLYYCLRDHAGLKLPPRKREVEYLGGDLYEKNGVEWYYSLFAGATEKQKAGDVSVEYLYDPRSPSVVARYAPDVRFVVSIRNPVDRALSAYYWNMRSGTLPYIDLDEGFSVALDPTRAAEDAKVRKCYDDLIRRGFYDEQVQRYLGHFDLDRFLFVCYEDIKSDPRRELHRVFSFLGVEPGFVPPSLNARPKHNTYLGPLIRIERFTHRSGAMRKVMDLVNIGMHKLGLEGSKPRLSPEIGRRLAGVFAPHVRGMKEIIERAPEANRPSCFGNGQSWLERWN